MRVLLLSVSIWLITSATLGTQAAPPQGPAPGTARAPAPPAGVPTSRPAAPARSAAPGLPPDYQAMVTRYCVKCHDAKLKTADLMLDKVDVRNVPAGAATWEKVIRKLRLGAMPPQGRPRPPAPVLDGFATWLEKALDGEYLAHVNPGRSPIHRLNRAEYANAIRELLDVDVDVSQMLPADSASYGFDNISDTLKISPMLVSRYLSAAEKIASVAVGDPEIGEDTRTWLVPKDLSSDQHEPGMPLGTIGGTTVSYNFPLDAEYVLKGQLWLSVTGGYRGLEGLEQPYHFEISIDGQRILYVPVGGKEDNYSHYQTVGASISDVYDRMTARTRVKAGPHKVSFAFVKPTATAVMVEHLQPTVHASVSPFEIFGAPRLTRVTIAGPYNATGVGDTPSRRKIFVCRPTGPADESSCAGQILSNVARRAYGRVPTDTELDELSGFYKQGRSSGTFDAGIRTALLRILSGPEFLLRSHPDPSTVAEGAVYKVTDAELASRLALFLWSSIPDDELLGLAMDGKLRGPGVLEQQVRRMLADPRSEAFITNFAGQWLFLRNLDEIYPSQFLFPEFDDNLRKGFWHETELFFGSMIREDRSVLDLFDADYTFVNERLARQYGIPNVYGPRFRRVTLTDENRRGLLGQGSVLSLTSVANRTSPVIRGKWVLSQILNSPPPPPPPNVPQLRENGDAGANPRTVRELMEEHRKNSPCSTCHRLMDPIGLSLENFDAVGKWRTIDAGQPIDASTQLFDGTKVNGPIELRRALLRRPNVIVGTVTEKMMTYALGRGVEYGDMPAVRAIVRDAAQHDYRFSSVIFGIINSVPFQMKVKRTTPATETLQ